MKKILTLVGVSLLSVAACKSDGGGGDKKGGNGGGNEGGSAGDGAGGSAGEGGSGTGGKATGGSGGKATGGAGGTSTGGAGGTSTGGAGGTSTGGTGGGGTGGTAVSYPVGSLAAKICNPATVYPAPFAAAGIDATLVKDGFKGAEGPVWVDADKALYFSEINRGNGTDFSTAGSTTIQKYTPANNMFVVWVAASGSNGLALDKDGTSILAATHDQQDVSAFKLSDKARTNKGFKFENNKFNAPNDITVRSDGTIYFTDPSWQIGSRSPTQTFDAAYRATPQGVVSAVKDNSLNDIGKPNGITLSPDEKTLYVGGNVRAIHKFAVNTDGSTGTMAKFADLSTAAGGYSDGMAVDCAGNLYVTSNKGVEVFDKTGKAIGIIATKKGAQACSASNVAFGDEDHKTLYITVEGCNQKALYKATLAVPGMPY